MAWSGKERRKQPRPTVGTPTYIVEKDAPAWKHPQSYDGRWIRKAIDKVRGPIHDAYPDHEIPFEDMQRQLPIVAEHPRPRVRDGDAHLIVVGKHASKVVPLVGVSLAKVDFGKRMVQAWILNSIKEAVDEVLALDEEHDKGQGLAEYALILALIAIVAIIALTILGQQIAQVFTDLTNNPGLGGGATPAP